MSLQLTLTHLLNATGSEESHCGPSPHEGPVSLTISPSGPDRAHASLSARQAQEMGLLTIATCGRTGFGLSRSASLTQSWANRFRQATASRGSPLYRLTWKERITPEGRSIYALRASARRISVSGFSCAGWPVPLAKDASAGPDYAIAGRDGSGGYSMPTTAALAGWSTASARDWKDTPGMAIEATNPDGSERMRLDQLPRQAMLAGWPTPDASLFNNTSTLELTQARRNRLKEKHGNSNGAGLVIATAAQTAQHPSPNGPFAIRCSIDHATPSGPTLTGCSVEILTDQGSGLLSPDHSRWLQGIPAEMANCVRMAMQSISKSRRRSSKPSVRK